MVDLAITPVELKAPEAVTRVVSDGVRVGFGLVYSDGASRVLQRAGANWLAARRMWVTRAGPAGELLSWLRECLQGHHLDVDAAGPLVAAALAKPERDYFAQVLDVQIFPLANSQDGASGVGGSYAVSFEYDGLTVDAMRSLRGLFHRHASAWQVHGTSAAILERLQAVARIAPEFIFVHERPVVLEELGSPGKSAAPLTVPGAAPPEFAGTGEKEEEGTGFLSTFAESIARLAVDEDALASASQAAGLRDYQVAGVRHLASQSASLLGDDMGLGKTRQTVVASRLRAGAGRVLIACPASLRINWEREIRMVYPDAIVGMVGEDRVATLYGCAWVIVNYERLGGLVRETGLDFAVMVVDEAHYLKEHHAGRTRNAFIMAARIPNRYLVTGTPLLNREIEMHTLLRLSGHALGHMTLKDFRKRYAGGSEQRAALADAIRGWMLRRRKDVLKDLGDKRRQTRFISPAEGIGAYEAILKDMTLTVMPKIVKLRQALERLKIDFIVETVQCLRDDDKVIVFCEYMDSVDALQSAFAAVGIQAVRLVGSDSGAKRQRAIDAFQNDAAARVFIGTTSAAGVGITLTAANYVLFASLPWTPAVMRQAEDRAYRLGQKRDVDVIVPLIPKTIDEQIWKLLDTKTDVEQSVVEAVRAGAG